VKVNKIFPTELWSDRVENYKQMNVDLLDSIYNMKDYDKRGIEISNQKGWHSNYFHTYKKSTNLQRIENIISEKINSIEFKYNLKSSLFWANINPKGAENSIHNHRESIYSGVYYIKIPQDSGNLVLLDMYHYYLDSKEIPKYTINPEEGMLYIFRGFLPHKVEQNLSNFDRVSISFNFYE